MQYNFNVKKLLCVGSVNLAFSSLAISAWKGKESFTQKHDIRQKEISLEKMNSKFKSLNIRPEITLNER